MRLLLTLVSFFFLSTNLNALSICHLEMDAGTTCQIEVGDLHPGQSAVGLRQVADKVAKFSDMNEKKLQKYLKKHPVPLVLSPDGQFYMTDKHHMSRAFMELERDDHLVYAEVKANWTKLDINKFWQHMKAKKYVWLFDENGTAFDDPTQLPTKILDLKNDPYRSLAWAVREAGGFEDLNLPFAELLWANYFRPLVKVGKTDKEFKKAVKAALPLAHDEAASDLPGYIPEEK